MIPLAPLLAHVPMDEVFADADFNCRGRVSPIDVADLAKDIEAKGLIQPITITPLKEGDNGFPEFKYKVIAGHRRHMAHKVIKAKTILSVVRDDMRDPIRARSFNLTENLQRSDLTILQEAKAIRHLALAGLSRKDIAKDIGMSEGWVQTRIMLLSLPEQVQQEVVACKFSNQEIRDVYTVQDKSGSEEAVFKAVREIKDAKIQGRRKPDVNKVQPVPKNKKRKRDYSEIIDLMTLIQEKLGNSFVTRSLAWCAGEIDDKEWHEDFKIEVEKKGGIYTVPKLQ